MDHDHGDLPGLIRVEQHQPGAAGGVAGAEEAAPAVAVQVGAGPHVGQRGRQVGLQRHRGRAADGEGGAERVDQVQRALAGAVVVAEAGVRREEGGQREGHLGGVEALDAGGRLLAAADADQRDAQAVLVILGVEPGDVEVRAEEQLVDVVGLPGGLPQRDPEGLLAAVELQADRRVRADRLAGAGAGGADQAVQGAVVEVAGQAEARVRGLPAGGHGRVGVHQEVEGVGDRVEVAVQRPGPAVVLQPPPLDPRQLGQRVDQLRLGRLAGRRLQAGEGRGGVAAVAPLQVVTLQGLGRPLAGPVELADAPLPGGDVALPPAGLDGDLGAQGRQRGGQGEACQGHGRATPSTRDEARPPRNVGRAAATSYGDVRIVQGRMGSATGPVPLRPSPCRVAPHPGRRPG